MCLFTGSILEQVKNRINVVSKSLSRGRGICLSVACEAAITRIAIERELIKMHQHSTHYSKLMSLPDNIFKIDGRMLAVYVSFRKILRCTFYVFISLQQITYLQSFFFILDRRI